MDGSLGTAGAVLAFPRPSSVTLAGWGLLAIFLGTIVGAVVQPSGLGLGPLCVIAVAVACSTQCLTITAALKDLGSKNLWLVVMAFFIARALTKSNLGARIARKLASVAGEGNTLALAYCFTSAELLLAPMIPSVTARSGSIIFPLIISAANERDPDGSRHVSSFLTLVAFQSSAITSAMFVTAMAGNPVVQGFANTLFKDQGLSIEVTPLNWMLGSILPGLICLGLAPLVVYFVHPPLSVDPWLMKQTNTHNEMGKRLDGKAVDRLCSEAGEARLKTDLFRETLLDVVMMYGDVEGRARSRAHEILVKYHSKDSLNTPRPSPVAKSKAAQGGATLSGAAPWTRAETVTLVTVVLMLFAWIAEGKVPGFKMEPTTTAFCGVSALILGRVLTWKDIISEKAAWNTLVWLAILSSLANALKDARVISFFSEQIAQGFERAHLEAWSGFSILTVVYIYSHYFFASCSAHMVSMYTAFLSVAISIGVRPLGAALQLGYASNIMGNLTHYASGAAPVLFGKGYVSLGEWWRVGFIVSVMNVSVFVLLGSVWMRSLGYM
eukprot:CAMPEP_0167777732 /NCGR_PEP_ID=MMETSP0111_2-20121227/3865_1 /TAXON_ID=91324 /ORGANISM="Lotharella globosa, Strain CCCM811" /LENGTH=552 /DNA_ID=CAMNT_0007667965 /DNA_START=110 /DNA_END=1769 /DNA_ORIENTATION=+